MSAFDDLKLAMIPSGFKDGKLYSVIPSDGNGDFDFTRSTYATRVNSQGLIEKERSNLVLQSNNFDTTWGVNFGLNTPTSGQTGYDGTSDAWLLEKDAYAFTYMFQDLSRSGLQTYSAYAKANTLSAATLYVNGNASNKYAKFNLSDGSVITTANIITSNAVDVGSGWYRLSITFDDTISRVRIYPDFSETSAGSIYIQDAQLEQGLVATDVIETTTSAVYTGITDNVPRLDYDGDCPSLLLEPQRQNLVIHSEYLEGLNQNTLNLSLSTNLSPEGKYNAYRAERVSGSQLGSSFAATSGETYTTSIYARSISGSGQINITDYQGSENIFNITSDWARYELSAEATQSQGRAYVRLPQVGDVVEFYGFQSEQGSYATSYIPTYGTSVTRNADECDNGGDSTIFNDNEGVLYAELSTSFEASSGVKSLSVQYDGNNYVAIYFRDNNNLSARVVGSGNVTQVDTSYATNTLYKIAVSYNSTNVKFYLNGTQVDIETTNTLPTSLNKLSFDRGGGNATNMNGKVKSLAYFNRALTDTELADLTT